MKNLLYFIILHLGAMIAAFIIGGLFNGFVFMPNFATDLVFFMEGDEHSLYYRICDDLDIWETVWQLLIFLGFSFLINSALKTLSAWIWVFMTAFCTFILCMFSWVTGTFDFGINAAFPNLYYEPSVIARLLLFVALEFAFIGGYSLLGKIYK